MISLGNCILDLLSSPASAYFHVLLAHSPRETHYHCTHCYSLAGNNFISPRRHDATTHRALVSTAWLPWQSPAMGLVSGYGVLGCFESYGNQGSCSEVGLLSFGFPFCSEVSFVFGDTGVLEGRLINKGSFVFRSLFSKDKKILKHRQS